MKTLTGIAVLAVMLSVTAPSFAAKSKKHAKAKKPSAAALHKTVKHSTGGVQKSASSTPAATATATNNGGASAHATVKHSTGGVQKSTGN